ncbi:hypothetical protein [Streptomyces cyaneofuscatus]|uniref:hypothetical protein n=1 Tax=Streptomyces cyaneofuscatus TaxID=66883 RepID=UPI003667A07E
MKKMNKRPDLVDAAKTLPPFDPHTAEFGHWYLWPEMSSEYRSVLLSLEDRNEFGAKAAICAIYYDGSIDQKLMGFTRR